MLLGARQFFEKRGAPTPTLPYEAEVEYLESTGTQYIKVGQIIGATSIDVRMAASEKPSSGCYKAFGDGYSTNFGDDFGINATGWAGVSNPPCVINQMVDVLYDANGRYVNSTNVGGNGTTFLSKAANGNNLFLFCGTNGTNAYITGSGNYMAWRGRIASCVVMSGTTKLVDMISVLFTDERGQSEGAMYDKVSGALFRNAGTGAFLYGPDKS